MFLECSARGSGTRMLMAVWGREGPGKMDAGVTGVSGGEGGEGGCG